LFCFVLYCFSFEISLKTCCEIVFARYDAERDEEFIRYPAVIRLDRQRLIVQLPIKGKTEKEMKFIGFREYLLDSKKKRNGQI